MCVAFAGTHVPLLTLLFYFITSTTETAEDKLRIVGIALLATLMGTAVTLLALHKLLSPIGLTARALRNYRSHQKLPSLPTSYTDDAGILMASTTQTLHQLDDFIHRLEDYDNLTELPNRKLFQERLNQEISGAKEQQQVVVFIVDIDGFKDLNTAESDEIGDRVLRTIAHRLAQYASKDTFLARMGNDEFALCQCNSLDDDFSTAQDILTLVEQPYLEISPELHITASIGISVYPADGTEPGNAIANAYTALQQAKNCGIGQYQFYSTEMATALQRRLRLAKDLRSATQKDELLLYYQPRVDWRNGNIVGAECLVRWQHSELGMISPADFIPIAESTGLIVPIGEWILQTACEQAKAWQRAGLPPFTVAVNLSARQIESDGLVERVQQVLAQTELSPEFLELEVTESLLIGEVEPTLLVLNALHQLGISIALDDFGTGYSSLSYLRKFPFDILKIDRAFVKDMVDSPDAAEVTQAIVALARGLKLGLIAEGVETEEQLNLLKTYDCHEIQGYYFSRPLPVDQLTQLLKQKYPWQTQVSAEINSQSECASVSKNGAAKTLARV
ncbi:bifunctional diguanylate cyclase/phosphodiesterase [cf. Phormidesmis sp. LEGE 11477]|uniref:putative bifunctional diguanylate cyclase/phosphodiesterase n=1 Tax=cf. Phormidesmis sp. LEGE 11477 TaxID=1828680 RepID=UPI001D14BAE4|nr:GGDEF domain-containing phosphodiesterase [cf. Phormidesmis sp. LEGE 11477]